MTDTDIGVGGASPRMCVFLDLDGVLHPVDKEIVGMDRDTEAKRVQLVQGRVHPDVFGLFCPARQALLVEVLQRHRHVDLVISSAIRNWEGYNILDPDDTPDPLFEARHVHSLDWLKRLLHPVISSRIIGRTGCEGNRIDQVQRVIDLLDWRCYARSWVAIDDQVAHFPPSRLRPFFNEVAREAVPDRAVDPHAVVVIVDGRRALTRRSADMLSAAIAHASTALSASSTPV